MMDMNEYKDFVERITSPQSNFLGELIKRCQDLENNNTDGSPDLNVSLFLTAAIGMGSECGEFQEIVKKVLFQGKPFNSDTVFHLKRELGDIMWYWVNACRSLDLDPEEVVKENINKLEARYDGTFSVVRSENRKEGDL